jgi:hypothetical protein
MQVHIWINNAGSAVSRGPLMDADPYDVASIVGTNLCGSLLCCREVKHTIGIQLLLQNDDVCELTNRYTLAQSIAECNRLQHA